MRTITLQGRGPNTMSRAMLEALDHELDAAGDEPLLLTGAGAAFSAGLDLDALAASDAGEVKAMLEAMERCTRKLFLHPAPTVAAVNGHAVAGGCLLVQCCDLRIATNTETMRMGMTGVALGLLYPPFVPAIFRARVPRAETVLMGAERVGPSEALALGMLDELVPAAEVVTRASERLEARKSLPRAAYASVKRALREPLYAHVEAAHARFLEESIASWAALVPAHRAARAAR
jgi:enoyl-CoA hydratase